MARTLVDLVLDDSPSKIAFPIHQISAVVLARMLLRVLMLLLWAEERRKEHDLEKMQRRLARKRKADGEFSGLDDSTTCTRVAVWVMTYISSFSIKP